MLKKILVITTGGTFGGETSDEAKRKTATAKKIPFNDHSLHIKWGIKVEIEQQSLEDEKGNPISLDSSNILPMHWKLLADKIYTEYDNYDSFVIIHGTNSLGYTSAALSFCFANLNKPVIITGSQVPYGAPGSDAQMNFDNSIRVATWPYNQIRGIVTVFGSNIITGVRSKKTTEFDYDAFRTFNAGNLGNVGRVILINEEALTKHNKYYEMEHDIALTQSELVYHPEFESNIVSLSEFPGMSPSILNTLVDNISSKGFIIRAFGAGDISSNLVEALEYLKSCRIPVVATTQAPHGNANFQVNEPGKYLKDNDLAIPAFDMSIESQVAKLSWLLAKHDSNTEIGYQKIKEMFLKDIKGEIQVIKERKQ